MTAILSLVLLLLSSSTEVMSETCSIRPVDLRCENLVDPIGIDVAVPRLSWVLEATDRQARGLVQTGYQIQVSRSHHALLSDVESTWDSGLVESSETDQIEFEGLPAVLGGSDVHIQLPWVSYTWRVRIRDGQGVLSPWSEPATFSTGIFEDVNTTWIGYDAARELAALRPTLSGASWICYPEPDDAETPAGKRYFRATFTLPEGTDVEEATLMITADDTLEVWVNGEHRFADDSPTPAWKRPAYVRLDRRLQPGVNSIAVAVENLVAGPSGLIGRMEIRMHEGEPVVVATGGDWRCATEPAEGWQQPDFDDSSWDAPRVIGEFGVEPWGAFEAGHPTLPPARYLRREFTLDRPVERAIVYASALGNYELRINGERVGDTWFDPGWTDYDKRVYYRAFDVTSMLHEGENVIAAILGDGWYSGYVGYKPERDHYGKNLRLRCNLMLDGMNPVLATDATWKASTGPIVTSDFLMGEVYDARLEQPGWDRPGFDDSAWAPVDVTESIPAKLQAHPGPPVRAIAEFPPRAITEPRPGVYVLDLGQNFAGVCRLRMKGERGDVVQLRFAERLNPDGTLYTTNLRAARATDTYVFRGTGEVEEWTPRFTFHGFQYVEVTGLDAPPPPDAIVGLALTSDTPRAGTFECSDPMLNQLASNILWTQRSNFIDVPTDCPQRDERLGWTGDAQTYIRTAACFSDVQPFFTKWLTDLADAQREDGQFPMVAPLKVAGGDGGPGWADAGTICPWAIWEVYGDRRLLERQYPSMVRSVDFCEKRSKDGVLPPDQFHCFGDWVSVGADTPKTVIYTAYYAHSVDLTARAARVLGREDDARRLEALLQRIKDAFVATYVDEDGRIEGNTQCDYVLALAFDLLPDALTAKAAEHLVERIEAREWHLSTGFLGTKDLMLVLSKIGREDVAYRLLHNETYPSWGFSIAHGATSIWERWNGWTPEQGFMDPGMNSFAHYSFGAVGQWLFENVGGIAPLEPGYRSFEIAPRPDGRLTWADVSYESVRGPIRSHWLDDPATFALEVTVPPNTSATIRVPFGERGVVTEGGKPVDEAEGITASTCEDGAACFAVGSGYYSFRVEKAAGDE